MKQIKLIIVVLSLTVLIIFLVASIPWRNIFDIFSRPQINTTQPEYDTTKTCSQIGGFKSKISNCDGDIVGTSDVVDKEYVAATKGTVACCVRKKLPSGPPVCGISIIKGWNEAGSVHAAGISINYNKIFYRITESSKTKYDFLGGFNTNEPIERLAVETKDQNIGSINDGPQIGYFDLVFYSQEISKENFEIVSNCVKSNLYDVKTIFQEAGYGKLRALVYTNRDPYVFDYYVCDNRRLLTLIKPTESTVSYIRNSKIDYFVGDAEDGSYGTLGFIINSKFYPDFISFGPFTQLTDKEISTARNDFELIAKCRNKLNQTIPMLNSFEKFIQNPQP